MVPDPSEFTRLRTDEESVKRDEKEYGETGVWMTGSEDSVDRTRRNSGVDDKETVL